jgi:hypothetical protein
MILLSMCYFMSILHKIERRMHEEGGRGNGHEDMDG